MYIETSQSNNEPIKRFRGVVILFCGIALIALILFTGNVQKYSLAITEQANLAKLKHKQPTSVTDKEVSPHIVFVLADDLGWNAIGYEDFDMAFVTPTLTSLAQSGLIMSNYYAQEQCTPSRASLMTGRYPLSVGMQYGVINPDNVWGLSLDETTIAEVLNSGGYKTHAIGKWHLGAHSPRFLPTARGFDTWTGYTQGYNYYWSKLNPEDPDFYDFFSSNKDCYYNYGADNMHNYSTHLYRDLAVDIIENHDPSESLFLYLPFQAVHDPFEDLSYDMTGDRLITANFMTKDMYEEIQSSVKVIITLKSTSAFHAIDFL